MQTHSMLSLNTCYDGDYAQSPVDEEEMANSWMAILHVDVLLMANRLCMSELEELAVGKMGECMRAACEMFREGCYWRVHNVVGIVEKVYGLTLGREEVDEEDGGKVIVDLTNSDSDDSKTSTSTPPRDPTLPTTRQALDNITNKSSSNTPELPELPKRIKPTTRLRTILAEFCAYKIEYLRLDTDFRKLLRDYPDFNEDLVMSVGKGSGMRYFLPDDGYDMKEMTGK